jgi:hypothetical protein
MSGHATCPDLARNRDRLSEILAKKWSPPEKQEPMRHLKKQERAAIEGVARRFSASRDKATQKNRVTH